MRCSRTLPARAKPSISRHAATGLLSLGMATCSLGLAADSETAAVALDTVKVEGRAPKKTAGQTTVITADDIRRLNIRSIADIFAKVPGAQSHSFGQGEIGNPFRLRGFVSDHGSEVAVYIDGVPQNLPSSSVGANGLAEYSWLTPEMIERIEVIQGPQTALAGDQALSGSVFITTKATARSSVEIQGASFGSGRLAGVYGGTFGQYDVLAVAEYAHIDGYRIASDSDRGNLFAKVSTVLPTGRLAVRANVYRADWSAPGYLDFFVLRNGGYSSPKIALFPDDGGKGRRVNFVVDHAPAGATGLTANVYYDHVRRNRFGAFLPSRIQNETDDQRNIYGTRAFYNWDFGGVGDLKAGYEYRHDTGDQGSFRTVRRQRTGLVNRDYHLNFDAISFYTEGSVRPFERLKLLGGLRYDIFRQDVVNRLTPSQSGSGSQTLASPHIGLVFTPLDWVDMFVNYGTGFRSLAVTELSPTSATRPQGFDLTPPQIQSRDAGFKLRQGPFRFNGSVYASTVADEIRETQPGSNNFQNIGNTRRDGYQLEGFWDPLPNLALTASYSYVDAKVTNPLVPGQFAVSSNPRSIITAGIQYSQPLFGGQLLVDYYAQNVGAKPFYVAGVVNETTPYQQHNLRFGFNHGPSSYSVFGTFRPRDFASDQSGSSFNPLPNFEFGGSYRYSF